MDENLYRVSPGGFGVWVPIDEVIQLLRQWDSMDKNSGTPSVTISKRHLETPDD